MHPFARKMIGMHSWLFFSLFSLCFEHCPELEKPGAIQGVACHVISFDARVLSQGLFPSPPVKQCWTKLNKPDLDFELATVELLPVGCLWVVLHCDHKLGISLGSVLCLIVSKTYTEGVFSWQTASGLNLGLKCKIQFHTAFQSQFLKLKGSTINMWLHELHGLKKSSRSLH